MKLCLFLCAAAMGASPSARAGGYAQSGHGSKATGVSRIPSLPRGSCAQCHSEGERVARVPAGLWRDNDNELCFTCHASEDIAGTYPGRAGYETSSHRTDARSVWPGPTPATRRESGAAGKCVNCHDPHGRQDRLGAIPSQLFAREEELCLGCHDGEPSAKDIARELRKPYGHATRRLSGRHRPDEAGDPALYSYAGGNRHVACSDCHNSHAVLGEAVPPIAPAASQRNARVSRIRVVNGAPGTMPLYEYRAANDTSIPVLEYEICFKCHSSWTRQPPGEQDMARFFNVNNASFHPVEGPGKNQGIEPLAFAGGKSTLSVIYCSDCHGSDDASLKGPHGSQVANILRRPYETRSVERTPARADLCFSCHNFDAYANPAAPTAVLQASRFNPPSSPQGHGFHAGERRIPCYACHDSHGSAQLAALLVTGRVPGLLTLTPSPTGGSCTPSCHATKTYQANYPR